MSFGFGIGEFLAVAKLANKVRKDFAGAPSQFKNISNEVRNLSIAIQDIDVDLGEYELEPQQKTDLQQLSTSCNQVLLDLEKTLSKYSELESSHGSLVSKGKRAWKRLKWEPDDIRELRDRITSNVVLLNNFHGRITNQITLEIRKGVNRLNTEQDNQERRNILDWITPENYSAQHIDHIKERQEGTGQWLLESPEFKFWLQGGRKTLFCPGIPGAGKTILTAAVIDHLLDQHHDDSSVGIAYIYCNFRWTNKQKLDDLLSSLLKQLAKGQSLMPDSVKEIYRRYKAEQRQPPTQELLKALHNVASLYPRVFILIDALDECQISGGCRNTFIEELIGLQASAGVNLFTTSRFLPEITDKFDRKDWLEIRATKADVERYLEYHIRKSSHTIQEMEEDIKQTISDTVDGMFLLARIYLELLTSEVKPKKIRAMLSRFKRTLAESGENQICELLHHAYNDAMERIKQQEPSRWELAKQALTWITCAMRPLRKAELQLAVTIEEGDLELDERDLIQIDDIIAVCAGLVTIDEESDIIRLVHFTTQEYFESTRDQWFLSAQEDITTVCVTYLSFEKFKSGPCKGFDDFENRLDDNALYSYAARNWGHHARRTSKLPSERILDFLKEHRQVAASAQVLFSPEERERRLYNSLFGLTKLLEQSTALHVVAYFGVDEGVQYLLDRHDAEMDLGDGDGLTPLNWAAMNGHQSMVRLLLENGANIESKDNDGRTPLSLAARDGGKEVVKLLLENSANIESRDNDGQTPLSLAAWYGEKEVVKLLLENSANIKSRDNDGRTPLSLAAWHGDKEVVKLLLENSANIESRDNNGCTPLSLAAWDGEKEIVKLLLENSANIESRDNDGQTPLSLAAELGQERVVMLLLKSGADIESKDNKGRTPLSVASGTTWGSETKAAVKLLLESGANIESKDDDGCTPLSLAFTVDWKRENEEVIKLLLESGADIESKDNNGKTVLSRANESDERDILEFLLEKRPETNSKNAIYERTPLDRAACIDRRIWPNRV